MSAGIEKQQIQFLIILLPNHQPVRFNVAFPLAIELPAKFVRSILSRKGSVFCKNTDGILNMRQIQAPFLAEFQVFLKSIGEAYAIHTMPESA